MQEDTNYLSRKFILSCYLILAATAMVVMKIISPEVWQAVSLGAAGIYGLANVAQKYLPDGKVAEVIVTASK